jgi:hypothetical protein
MGSAIGAASRTCNLQQTHQHDGFSVQENVCSLMMYD